MRESPQMSSHNGFKGFIKRTWSFIARPSTRYPLGVLVFAGGVLGVLFWGGFNWGMELTNTEPFCTSCHEMRRNPFEELKKTIHYENRSGVRATCPDCHVPREWIYKVWRKIQASKELLYHILGELDTPERFEKQRPRLAQNVWATMKATDSRECRNCHSSKSMSAQRQTSIAQGAHMALKGEATCIDCHRGIAHRLPD